MHFPSPLLQVGFLGCPRHPDNGRTEEWIPSSSFYLGMATLSLNMEGQVEYTNMIHDHDHYS